MNDDQQGNEEDREPYEQRLIDSLLESAIGNANDEAQAKVSAALSKLDADESNAEHDGENDDRLVSANNGNVWFARRTWIGIATAAAVMIAVALPFIAEGQSAMATIRLSLAQANKDVARHYSLESTFQRKGGQTYERYSDLFVKGNDRFAIRKAGLLGREWWLGGDGDKTWALPPIGPIVEGDHPELSRWLKRKPDLSTPYLHVSSILERMGNGYKLTKHGEATLTGADGREIRCRHIVGRLRRAVDVRDVNDRIPDRIELWASLKSGVAQKVVASWDLDPGSAGRVSMTVELLDHPELSDDWFQPEGHYDGERRRISFNSNEM